MPEMSAFANSIFRAKYSYDQQEEWADTAKRVTTTVLAALGYMEHDTEVRELERLIAERKFLPGGRYLYAAGRDLHQVNNCLLLRAEDSREGWAGLWEKAGMALMTGAGIGIDYSDIRESGAPVRATGGVASGPLSVMKVVNEIGREVMQGGSRRSAIWAGLRWDHPDILNFIGMKNWSEDVRRLKAQDFNFPATMDMTNISVQLDRKFFDAFEKGDAAAHDVYWATLNQMVTTAEPGFSVDLDGETLRNACTEVTSDDDSDICNLGSLNLANFDSLAEFRAAIDLAVLFLVAGSVYSHVPYNEVTEVREKNRRLGLGLMGVHEWLLRRDRPYGPDNELARWMAEYKNSTALAAKWADQHSLSRPVKTRAIAPTGTISIVAETTSGIEPIFCTAYKRRYLASGTTWKYQLVVDPTAKKLIDLGISPYEIEDAYDLSYSVERRVRMQSWMQQYVDHAISSTINLPAPLYGEDATRFGTMLMKYLPTLRGITAYPNGAREGQPLTKVDLSAALGNEGVVYEESEEKCVGGVCGS